MQTKLIVICWIFVFIPTVQIKAVSVSPDPFLCPTNKIAPHRRISRSSRAGQPRTFGAYYDLLTPSFNQQQAPSDAALQEEPQPDDPNDCGDIDDYDENDLSSLTWPQQQRRGFHDGRFFFGGFRPPSVPMIPMKPMRPPPNHPPRPPQGNHPAQRPPYWSGGQFGNNPYRPPANYYPSDNIKPVYEEGINDPPETYRPDVVGGPIYSVVGASPAPFRPPRPRLTRPNNNPNRDRISATQTQNYPSYDNHNQQYTTTKRPQSSNNYDRYATQTDRHTTRRPRPKKLNSDDSIIQSFLDLLF